MSFRFSNTDKWSDEWFINLTKDQKLMFLYFCDTCDIAGFYELSLKRMAFDLSMNPQEIKIAFKGLSKSYILSTDKKIIFIKNFMKHQKNIPLNTNNKSHIGIISRYKLYKDKFDFNVLNIFETNTKNGGRKGLKGSPGKGNGNDIFKDNRCIEFEVFWNLYSYRIGDKKKCKIKWESLEYEIQEKIIVSLPMWNKQFDGKHFKPHPITYLNQERWNDEIIIHEAVKSVNGVTKDIIF
jgi:hypothetical protein